MRPEFKIGELVKLSRTASGFINHDFKIEWFLEFPKQFIYLEKIDASSLFMSHLRLNETLSRKVFLSFLHKMLLVHPTKIVFIPDREIGCFTQAT